MFVLFVFNHHQVDESELQDEPLQLRLMDHDTYSANDAIGKVVISLAPLLAREANNAKGTTGPPGSKYKQHLNAPVLGISKSIFGGGGNF